MTNLNIGVIGVGHLGKIHVKLIKEIPSLTLIGINDSDSVARKQVEQQYHVKGFDDHEALIDGCDIVDIVSPTSTHFDLACKAIKKGKHVFIEKPITSTIEEATILQRLAREAGVLVQVGLVERFNSAYRAATPYIKDPMFFEIHRLTQYNPMRSDISVVMDLMLHDIDLVLSTMKANTRKIHANGINVVSQSADIANARVEFDNGCVVNFTASRIALKNERKFRLFQKNAYINIDLLDKKVQISKLKSSEAGSSNRIIDMGLNKPKHEIYFEYPIIEPGNAIKNELESFINAIKNKQPPEVTIAQATQALTMALDIEEKIKLNQY